MHDFRIRFVRQNQADAEAILTIYAPYVRDTPITFEYEVPNFVDFAGRIGSIAVQYPYIVSEREGKILAYAYASRHLERIAYAWDVQVSVYAAPEVQGVGMARALYTCLFGFLAKLGYRNAYAIITLPNSRSVRFHESFGFLPAGVHYKSGYKHGAWHDVTWMQKQLAEYLEDPLPPKPVSALDAAFCDRMFASCSR